MITANPTASMKAIQSAMERAGKDKIKKATAAAITKTAQAVVAAEKTKFKRVLDRPRPFTVNAVNFVGASWDKTPIKSRVFIMDTENVPLPTAKYLEPYEFGGRNVLNPSSKALVKPVAQTLDQFGNIPWGTVAKLKGGTAVRNGKAFSYKGRGDIFVGTLRPKGGQPISGVWQRPYKAPVTERRRKGSGKYGAIGKRDKRSNLTGHFILLIRFQDPHPIAGKNRLHWFDTAAVVIKYDGQRLLRQYMRQYIPQAIRNVTR